MPEVKPQDLEGLKRIGIRQSFLLRIKIERRRCQDIRFMLKGNEIEFMFEPTEFDGFVYASFKVTPKQSNVVFRLFKNIKVYD